MKKNNLQLIFFLTIFYCFQIKSLCQTVGIGEVTAIESKAIQYEQNKKSISQAKEDLVPLEDNWRKKIKALRNELAALIKERDDLIADMKVGAKCSQCGKYKSEFEKAGIDFQKHLGEVKGYAVPASTEELESTRELYREKIAYKKVQIQNLEKGDNAIIQKQNQIKELEKRNESLCSEITAHSKRYETKVFSEAKSMQDDWMNNLMGYATTILISNDNLAIYKARITRYEMEFQLESEKIRDRVKAEVTEEKDSKNKQITVNVERIAALQKEHADHLSPLEKEMDDLKQKRAAIEMQLTSPNLTDSIKAALVSLRNDLNSQITSLDKSITEYNTSIQNKILSLDTESQQLKNEVFQLDANLSKRQTEEIAKLRATYDEKKADANQSIKISTSVLTSAKKTYSETAGNYDRQNQEYVSMVVSETNRMTIASQKISCPVYNQVRFAIMTNWNQVFPCVNSITTLTKPYSTHSILNYCPGISAAGYMASYKSFLLGLDNDDRKAVEANTNSGWFELITK